MVNLSDQVWFIYMTLGAECHSALPKGRRVIGEHTDAQAIVNIGSGNVSEPLFKFEVSGLLAVVLIRNGYKQNDHLVRETVHDRPVAIV